MEIVGELEHPTGRISRRSPATRTARTRRTRPASGTNARPPVSGLARSSARRTSTTRTARLGRHSCSTRSRRRFLKKLRDGEWYPSLQDKPRFYEGFSRSVVFVPRVAPFRSDIDHISPNERLSPTEHKADHGRFYGTVLSAVDLAWFTEEDHASKSNYADWAGSIGELPEPEFGIHKHINDIVPGYYVKIDSSETKKYAVSGRSSCSRSTRTRSSLTVPR